MTCNFLHYLPAATTRKSGLLVLILLVAMTSAHGGYLALFDAQDLSQSTQIWHHIPVANNNSLPGNLSVLPSFAHQTAVLGTERSRHALHLGWIGLIVMAWFAWWRKKVERKENEYEKILYIDEESSTQDKKFCAKMVSNNYIMLPGRPGCETII